MLPETLGVIGLGAVGGSVAWQAARSGIARVVGYDPSTRDGVAAVRAGAVTELVRDAADVVRAADLVVLAASPRQAETVLRGVADALARCRPWCTDVAPVKHPIMTVAKELDLAASFAGSHPFVDFGADGFKGAGPDRLAGAVVYVTPLAGGERAAAEIGDFWSRTMRAYTVTLDADRHDALLAWTSHLPRAVAAALAATLGANAPAGVTVGRAAVDATRSAQSGVEQWSDVLLANRDQVLAALTAFAVTVDELEQALRAGDRRRVEGWLAAGAGWRARFDT